MEKALANGFKLAFERIRSVSEDLGEELEKIMREGIRSPLDRQQAGIIVGKIIKLIQKKAQKTKDEKTLQALAEEIQVIANRIINEDSKINAQQNRRVDLVSHGGIDPKPLIPKRVFHGVPIDMRTGFVRTTDINLWEDNDRLEIHVGQFRQQNGRSPSAEELLHIMLGEMSLPGLKEDSDQFKIRELARSVAINGVRVPPIIDMNGILLDGNRRVAACYYILNSNEFTSEEKARVQYIWVWQLNESATEDDRDLVVVSLNFEPECKAEWSEYVKAKKIHQAWAHMKELEPTPGPERLKEMRKELSQRFALGSRIDRVKRYLQMVEIANEFEDHQINERGQDKFAVRHKVDQYFQYFEELGKGTTSGGVRDTLEKNEAFKHLVYDLLYQDKIENFALIRSLKFYNDEMHNQLTVAREEADVERAAGKVEDVLTEARNQNSEARIVQADTRIQNFVKWLENLPIAAFRDQIKSENMDRLLKALQLVAKQVEERNA